MKILFIGSSSKISQVIKQKLKLKNVISISKEKLNKNIVVKSYSEKNIEQVCKLISKKKLKFDRIVIFNGYHQLSTFTHMNLKLFNKIYFINVVVPLIFLSNMAKYNLLNKNSSFIFIGSIASELNEIGNAYYALAKNTLRRSLGLLKEEFKSYRFNIFSLGLVKNKMSKKLIENLPINSNKEDYFINENKMTTIFKKILFDKKSNGKIVEYHGKYEVKN